MEEKVIKMIIYYVLTGNCMTEAWNIGLKSMLRGKKGDGLGANTK